MMSTNRFRTLLAGTVNRTVATMAIFAFALIALCATASAQRTATARRGSAPARTSSPTVTSSGASTSYVPQRTLMYGGTVGTSYMLYSGTPDMTGFGYHIGGIVDIPVGNGLGVVAKAGYESKHGSGTSSYNGSPVDVAITMNFFELSGAVRRDLSSDFMVEGGLAIQLDAGGHDLALSTASESASIDVEEAGGRLTMPTQVALTAGAGYRIHVSPTTEIIPTASFNFFLTSPETGGNASSHVFRVGTRVMFR